MRELIVGYRNGIAVVQVSDVDYERCRGYRWRVDDSSASGTPYIKTTIPLPDGRKTSLYLHRFITHCPAAYKVDHIDNDPWNNQRDNLRIASHDQNNANRTPWGSCGYKGVSRNGFRFRARITVNHVEKYLGQYKTAEEAARVYDKEAYAAFGEFAWLNFPEAFPGPVHDIPRHQPIPF